MNLYGAAAAAARDASAGAGRGRGGGSSERRDPILSIFGLLWITGAVLVAVPEGVVVRVLAAVVAFGVFAWLGVGAYGWFRWVAGAVFTVACAAPWYALMAGSPVWQLGGSAAIVGVIGRDQWLLKRAQMDAWSE